MSELCDAFLETYKLKVRSGSIKPISLKRYYFSINTLFDYDPTLSNKPLADITWQDFEHFKIYRLEEGFSAEGINTNLRNFRTIFNFGEAKDYLKSSPLRIVDYIKTEKQDARYLNENEMRRLHSALEDLDLNQQFQRDARDLVLFYLYTGARASEALYPDFDWNCVDQNRIHFPKTKTYKGRSIPLTQRIEDVLEGRRSITGGPFHFTIFTVYNRTKFVFEKAELDDVSTHNLRKTAGAYYYMATRDIFATSRFLGHSSVKVTESHYVGLIQSLQKEYSNLFDSILTNKLEKSR